MGSERLIRQVALIVPAILVSILPTFCRADDDDTIEYRRHVMHSMGEQYAAIEMMQQKEAPADSLATQLHALATTASMARKAFEPKIPGGQSKPEVWQHWADFSNRLDQLNANISALAKTSGSAPTGAVDPRIQASLFCNSCHEAYHQAPEAASVVSVPPANSTERNVIDYREHIMNTLNDQSDALGMILSTAIPADNAAAHLEVIALTASSALQAFEPKVPGGQSKPEVWGNWPDFSKRMNELAVKTAEVAGTARQRGVPTALAGVVDALTCKSCHELYRREKKK